MPYYADKLVNIAQGEEDYHEKKSNYMLDDKYANAGKNNYTKYARDLWDKWNKVLNGNKQGFEWCAVYVLWLFLNTYGDADKALKVLHLPTKSTAAGVPYFYDYMKKAGLTTSTPSVGDVIFLNSAKHVGIVKEIKDGKVFTSEGNSNNMVRTVAYKLGDSHIYAYGHPDWAAVPEPTPAPTPTPPPDPDTVEIPMKVLIPNKSTGGCVKTFQRIMRELGYKDQNGKLIGVDGDYGNKSVYVCKTFQQRTGIPVTGTVDYTTWLHVLN